MAETKVQLKTGIPSTDQAGNTTYHTEAVLGELNTGDLFDAQEDSERPVNTPAGWQLVGSPARLGVELLRRQVRKVGDIPGPLSPAMLRKLTTEDLAILQTASNKLDAAVAKAMEARGRDGAADRADRNSGA